MSRSRLLPRRYGKRLPSLRSSLPWIGSRPVDPPNGAGPRSTQRGRGRGRCSSSPSACSDDSTEAEDVGARSSVTTGARRPRQAERRTGLAPGGRASAVPGSRPLRAFRQSRRHSARYPTASSRSRLARRRPRDPSRSTTGAARFAVGRPTRPPSAPRSSYTTSSASPTRRSARSSDARLARAVTREPGSPCHPGGLGHETRQGQPDADIENEQHRAVSERFIEACAGGDISALMEVLDPDVVGEATIFGFGPLLTSVGRPVIAQRLLGLFGPGTESALIPFTLERPPGVVAFVHRRVAAFVGSKPKTADPRHSGAATTRRLADGEK